MKEHNKLPWCFKETQLVDETKYYCFFQGKATVITLSEIHPFMLSIEQCKKEGIIRNTGEVEQLSYKQFLDQLYLVKLLINNELDIGGDKMPPM